MSFLTRLFGKKPAGGGLDNETALRMVMGDNVKDISYKELCLSNKFSQEALVSLLIRKGVITGEEMLAEFNQLSKQNEKAVERLKLRRNGDGKREQSGG
ncbi:hypothetical protein JW905_13995 [bacterium]|nr:hypothetical protein [candidate division CSSED10-310 bacterium]